MKVKVKELGGIFPMPVLMVGSYNEDGSVNVMTAAWGTMQKSNCVMLKLTETHKTVENIKERKAFTLGISDEEHLVEADYFGIESGNQNPNKFENSGLTSTKSETVDAPIINEIPVCIECKFVEYQPGEWGAGLIGEVVNIIADEDVIADGNIDVSKINAITFDPYSKSYYKIGEKVGDAFKDGLALKK